MAETTDSFILPTKASSPLKFLNFEGFVSSVRNNKVWISQQRTATQLLHETRTKRNAPQHYWLDENGIHETQIIHIDMHLQYVYLIPFVFYWYMSRCTCVHVLLYYTFTKYNKYKNFENHFSHWENWKEVWRHGINM